MNRRFILFIDSLGSGGAQNQVVKIAQELSKRGITILVIYYHDDTFFRSKLKRYNIKHKLLNKSNLGTFNFLKTLRREIIENQISHFISFLEGPNFYASLIKLVVPSKSYILIVSERSRTPKVSLVSKYFWIKKFTYMISSRIMTNSIHERENLIDQFNINPSKIFTQYNFVDLNQFTAKIKNKFTHKLLVVGKPRPDKNGLLLIEAMNILKKSDYLNFELHWIGEYNFKNIRFINYVNEMNSRIKNYNLSSYWNWSGPVKIDSKLYQNFDALIFPSKLEGLPNVVCESLASGIPVVISNIFDHPILVENKKRGFTFNPTSSDELASRILELYNLSIYDYNSMQKSCYNYAAEAFDDDELYNNLLININK